MARHHHHHPQHRTAFQDPDGDDWMHDYTPTAWESIAYWITVGVVTMATVFCVAGVAGYLYAQ